MNHLVPHLKMCSIAAAIVALTACGGGSDTAGDALTGADCTTAAKSGDATLAQLGPAGTAQPLYARDNDGDDHGEREDDDDDGDDDDIRGSQSVSTPVVAAAPAPSPAATSESCVPATPSAPSPAPAPVAPAPAPTPSTPAAPSPSPTPTPVPAPAPAPAPPPASTNSVRGKALYSANCAACHGANPLQNISSILKGRNASTTLAAIANNKGGMGFLKSTIGASEATDIAIYLNAP